MSLITTASLINENEQPAFYNHTTRDNRGGLTARRNNNGYGSSGINSNGNGMLQSNRNRTQKNSNYPTSNAAALNSQKVNNVLDTIHGSLSLYDETDQLAEFTPIPPPQPGRVPNKYPPIQGHGMQQRPSMTDGDGMTTAASNTPTPTPTPTPGSIGHGNDIELHNLDDNFMSDEQVQDYYRRVLPAYYPNQNQSQSQKQRQMRQQRQTQSHLLPSSSQSQYQQGFEPGSNGGGSGSNPFINKLNYIIHLLEQHQDDRTGHVTEDVILYGVLGIFIIFISDSFVRIGKYVR